uniref:G_PROTEIN_RECEP_F1_2 domain-containing protein n=1 Tax=Globodera pallida TaxID=36090 RepID=A0A183CDH6_GLOPA
MDILDPQLLLVLPNSSSSAHICSSRILQLSLWFISSLDVLLAVLAVSLNSLLTASIFFARPLSVSMRRSFSIVSISYAFLAGILLAKKCFWLSSALSAGSPCVPLVSSGLCKLQEFPVVAVYLHSLASPLAFAVQMYANGLNDKWTCWDYYRGRKVLYGLSHQTATDGRRMKGTSSGNVLVSPPLSHRRRSSSTQPPTFLLFWLCSTQQMALVVFCLVLAFLFTAFDQETSRRKVLVNCSLPLAVHQKKLLFALLTLMLSSQLVQTLLWQSVSVSSSQQQQQQHGHQRGCQSHRPPSLLRYLTLSFRDLFLIEAILWSLSAFFTGLVLFQQFVLTKPCGRCTRLMVELAFTTLPLVVSLFHPILSVLIVAPISYSAQRFCPILKKALPEQEPATPPLPRPVPTVRILITEH